MPVVITSTPISSDHEDDPATKSVASRPRREIGRDSVTSSVPLSRSPAMARAGKAMAMMPSSSKREGMGEAQRHASPSSENRSPPPKFGELADSSGTDSTNCPTSSPKVAYITGMITPMSTSPAAMTTSRMALAARV